MFQEYAGTYLDIVKIMLPKFSQQEYIEVHYNEYFPIGNWNMEQHVLYYDHTLIKKIQIGLHISIKCYMYIVSSLPCGYRTVEFWIVMFVRKEHFFMIG